MRLSEAIRLGAMLKPQAFNSRARDASCTLRAATEALGIPDHVFSDSTVLNYAALEDRYPFLVTATTHPVDGSLARATAVIWNLNDTHQWTREQIADWVESIEPVEMATDDSIGTTEAPCDHQEDGRGTQLIRVPATSPSR